MSSRTILLQLQLHTRRDCWKRFLLRLGHSIRRLHTSLMPASPIPREIQIIRDMLFMWFRRASRLDYPTVLLIKSRLGLHRKLMLGRKRTCLARKCSTRLLVPPSCCALQFSNDVQRKGTNVFWVASNKVCKALVNLEVASRCLDHTIVWKRSWGTRYWKLSAYAFTTVFSGNVSSDVTQALLS